MDSDVEAVLDGEDLDVLAETPMKPTRRMRLNGTRHNSSALLRIAEP